MSSPRIIVQILVTGAQIFGRALSEAGKQAVKNAKYNPQAALGADAAGVGNARSGSPTDSLTRTHRMTLDEAHLILNIKRGEEMEKILTNYEHLFKQNSPPPPPAKPAPGAGKAKAPPAHSHYLQSKVVMARERIEAEVKIASESQAPPPPGPGAAAEGNAASAGPSSSASSSTQPPPS